MEQQLIIMRGASGSGKSTRALEIAREQFGGTFEEGGNVRIFSTDELFYKTNPEDPTGPKTYQWSRDFLGKNHQRNQDRTRKALVAGFSVIVDNTNLTRRDCVPYVEMAVARGIPVCFEVCNGNFENSHGVTPERVEQMRLNMEEVTVENVLDYAE